MDSKTNKLNRGLLRPHTAKLFKPPVTFYQEDYNFSLDNYSYKLVSVDSEKEVFDNLVYNNFYEALMLKKDSSEYAEIISKSKELDEKLEKNIIRIIAYDKNYEAVATICAYLDYNNLLPVEIKENCNYSDLRKLCVIMEVGRLSIRKDYRLKPLLSYGLILFVIDVAIKNNVDVIIESSFPDKIKMFMRIGFRRFRFGDSYDQIYKIPKVLCYYNFASKLYGYFNKQIALNNHELSNYNRKIFELVGYTKLRNAYKMLIERNYVKSEFAKTFNLDYSFINVLIRSSYNLIKNKI